MFTVENEFYIDRPPQEIFEFATDPANAHKWQGPTVSAEWATETHAGAGSGWCIKTRFLGREMESETEYTAWEPPNCCSFRVIDGPVPVEATWRFEPDGKGTQCIMRGKVEANGFFKLAEGLLKKQIEKQHEADAEILKQLLEAS